MRSPDSEVSALDKNQASIVEETHKKTPDVNESSDLFDRFIKDDSGVQQITGRMLALGIDIEAVRRRVNYDLHPNRKPEKRPDRTRNLAPLRIVYLHLHEYITTLIKCLELVEGGETDVAIFHKDANLRKAAMKFAQRLTAGSPTVTRLELLSLSTDLHVLRTIESEAV